MKALTDVLDTIEESSDNSKISLNEIVDALAKRGFGPLLIGPALITILPTGAIPLVPGLCATIIFLIAGQILIGKKHPWFPKKLLNISFNRSTFEKGHKKIRPYAEHIDAFFHPRLEFLTRQTAQRVIAFLCLILSVIIIIFGAIPLLPAVPASAILFFGLGLTVHDGLLTSLGLVTVIATLLCIPIVIST